MWNGTGDAIGTGLLEQAEKYGGLKIIQEDGAPGHGYSNRKKGKPPTAEHDRFTTEAEAKGMKVERQSANSPELNDLDLGVWFALDAAKERRYKEFFPACRKRSSSTSFGSALSRSGRTCLLMLCSQLLNTKWTSLNV
jgi:hypothetical protein